MFFSTLGFPSRIPRWIPGGTQKSHTENSNVARPFDAKFKSKIPRLAVAIVVPKTICKERSTGAPPSATKASTSRTRASPLNVTAFKYSSTPAKKPYAPISHVPSFARATISSATRAGVESPKPKSPQAKTSPRTSHRHGEIKRSAFGRNITAPALSCKSNAVQATSGIGSISSRLIQKVPIRSPRPGGQNSPIADTLQKRSLSSERDALKTSLRTTEVKVERKKTNGKGKNEEDNGGLISRDMKNEAKEGRRVQVDVAVHVEEEEDQEVFARLFGECEGANDEEDSNEDLDGSWEWREDGHKMMLKLDIDAHFSRVSPDIHRILTIDDIKFDLNGLFAGEDVCLEEQPEQTRITFASEAVDAVNDLVAGSLPQLVHPDVKNSERVRVKTSDMPGMDMTQLPSAFVDIYYECGSADVSTELQAAKERISTELTPLTHGVIVDDRVKTIEECSITVPAEECRNTAASHVHLENEYIGKRDEGGNILTHCIADADVPHEATKGFVDVDGSFLQVESAVTVSFEDLAGIEWISEGVGDYDIYVLHKTHNRGSKELAVSSRSDVHAYSAHGADDGKVLLATNVDEVVTRKSDVAVPTAVALMPDIVHPLPSTTSAAQVFNNISMVMSDEKIEDAETLPNVVIDPITLCEQDPQEVTESINGEVPPTQNFHDLDSSTDGSIRRIVKEHRYSLSVPETVQEPQYGHSNVVDDSVDDCLPIICDVLVAKAESGTIQHDGILSSLGAYGNRTRRHARRRNVKTTTLRRQRQPYKLPFLTVKRLVRSKRMQPGHPRTKDVSENNSLFAGKKEVVDVGPQIQDQDEDASDTDESLVYDGGIIGVNKLWEATLGVPVEEHEFKQTDPDLLGIWYPIMDWLNEESILDDPYKRLAEVIGEKWEVIFDADEYAMGYIEELNRMDDESSTVQAKVRDHASMYKSMARQSQMASTVPSTFESVLGIKSLVLEAEAQKSATSMIHESPQPAITTAIQPVFNSIRHSQSEEYTFLSSRISVSDHNAISQKLLTPKFLGDFESPMSLKPDFDNVGVIVPHPTSQCALRSGRSPFTPSLPCLGCVKCAEQVLATTASIFASTPLELNDHFPIALCNSTCSHDAVDLDLTVPRFLGDFDAPLNSTPASNDTGVILPYPVVSSASQARAPSQSSLSTASSHSSSRLLTKIFRRNSPIPSLSSSVSIMSQYNPQFPVTPSRSAAAPMPLALQPSTPPSPSSTGCRLIGHSLSASCISESGSHRSAIVTSENTDDDTSSEASSSDSHSSCEYASSSDITTSPQASACHANGDLSAPTSRFALFKRLFKSRAP